MAPAPDALRPAASFDGGNLDCGNGLLLLIRRHIDPLPLGGLLEIRSRERSVREDLPAWCRLTGNPLVAVSEHDGEARFLVRKGGDALAASAGSASQTAPPAGEVPTSQPSPRERRRMPHGPPLRPVAVPDRLLSPTPAPAIPELAVMGIGSWPRTPQLLADLHAYLEGRLDESRFQRTADEAVLQVLQWQVQAGVDVVTDGEQRRDNYASFVGMRLDNCQLVPLSDLLPYVDHPEEFAAELAALEIPANQVRHPAVFGPLGRSRSLARHEFDFVAAETTLPVKIALPGPYLLTRMMWMECLSDRAYESRYELAVDIVRILREELHELLHAGVAIVQFDEPVLSEVVWGRSGANRTFMCGALGSKLPIPAELRFVQQLYRELTHGLPADRLAVHICRGNWSRDESHALAGDYAPLLPLLKELPVGTLFLELCTPRAGELEILADLPASVRVGVGVVNQKLDAIEASDSVVRRIERAVRWWGPQRVFLTPDCGFATFADKPLAAAAVACEKLRVIALARAQFLGNRSQGR